MAGLRPPEWVQSLGVHGGPLLRGTDSQSTQPRDFWSDILWSNICPSTALLTARMYGLPIPTVGLLRCCRVPLLLLLPNKRGSDPCPCCPPPRRGPCLGLQRAAPKERTVLLRGHPGVHRAPAPLQRVCQADLRSCAELLLQLLQPLLHSLPGNYGLSAALLSTSFHHFVAHLPPPPPLRLPPRLPAMTAASTSWPMRTASRQTSQQPTRSSATPRCWSTSTRASR